VETAAGLEIPGNTRNYLEVLGNTPQTGGRYWEILGNTGKYWEILGNTGKYWEILRKSRKYPEISGNTRKNSEIAFRIQGLLEIPGNTVSLGRPRYILTRLDPDVERASK